VKAGGSVAVGQADPWVGEPNPDTPLVPEPGMRSRVARGTLVNAAFNVGLSAIGLLKGFIVAGFLTTTEYGVWGFLFISLSTMVWLKQVGIGDKYIQQEEQDQEVAFQKAFTLELLVTGAFTLVLLAAVPVLALVTGESELIAPGIAIALSMPAISLQTPLWIFYRRMNFMRQRSLQAIDPLLGAAVTIGLAAAGAGYWSLVAGLVVGSWSAAAAALLASPYRLALRYDRGTLREYASFSWPLFVAAAASLILPQGSMLLGEHVVGLAGVGAIALAVTVAQFAHRVDEVVTGTLYPAICRVRDRTDLLLESFVKSNRLALMWGMPFGVALALFAPDIVEFGIGERWEPAVGLIQVFGLMAAADQIGFNWDAYFRARGDTRPIAIVSVINGIVFVAVTAPLLIAYELDGYAAGMAILTAVSLAARTFFLARLFDDFGFLRHAIRAAAPVVPAAAAVLCVRLLESGARSPSIAIAEAAGYLLVVAAATYALERPLIREVLSYLRGGRATAPASL
jgi:O-antigen/teichoic acid export membrane protein